MPKLKQSSLSKGRSTAPASQKSKGHPPKKKGINISHEDMMAIGSVGSVVGKFPNTTSKLPNQKISGRKKGR